MLHKLEMFCIRMCSLIDVCFSIFSSIILPNCILLFLFIIFFSLHCIALFFCSLFVLKVRMSPLFIKGYLTWLDFTVQSRLQFLAYSVRFIFWPTMSVRVSEWIWPRTQPRFHSWRTGVQFLGLWYWWALFARSLRTSSNEKNKS